MNLDYLIENLVHDDTKVVVQRFHSTLSNSIETLSTGLMNWDNYPVLQVENVSFNLENDVYSIAQVHDDSVEITLFIKESK